MMSYLNPWSIVDQPVHAGRARVTIGCRGSSTKECECGGAAAARSPEESLQHHSVLHFGRLMLFSLADLPVYHTSTPAGQRKQRSYQCFDIHMGRRWLKLIAIVHSPCRCLPPSKQREPVQYVYAENSGTSWGESK